MRQTAVQQKKADSILARRKGNNVEPKAEFAPAKHEVLEEQAFLRSLYLERKRSERSRRPFLLALMRSPIGFHDPSELVEKIATALSAAKRETDTIGWYEHSHVLGLLFTEFAETGNGIVDHLRNKVITALRENLTESELTHIELTFHVFPEEGDHPRIQSDLTLYPDLTRRPGSKKTAQHVKRFVDIVGSLFAIAILSPVFLVVAIAVRLTSSGPILFRQNRIGQFGRTFTFLKFRSMYTNCDSKIHQQYVTQYINGQANKNADETGNHVFKLTRDPRVTPLGRFLRKTSLDELPQFFNVLIGEMSLVGPRPPVPYEFENYNPWHRRRVVEAKPGITGQWQISGRSKTTFDEMVRLDIRYIDEASLWLDLKILIKTPLVIVSGDGGY
jgi:lipopolysaccharide/colanic/teichoic acid biosynthesis glycosyltransferase